MSRSHVKQPVMLRLDPQSIDLIDQFAARERERRSVACRAVIRAGLAALGLRQQG